MLLWTLWRLLRRIGIFDPAYRSVRHRQPINILNILNYEYYQVQWAASVRVSGVSSGCDVPDTQESVGLE